MSSTPVVNASPLIFLSRANLIDFLKLAGEQIVVPTTVAHEILQRGRDDETARTIETTPWITVVDAPSIPAIIQSWDLGPGESSVLAWAYNRQGTEAIVDDLAARRCAAALNVPVRGTLGLVLAAKKTGRISKARPIIDRLRLSGMYLSDSVVERALAIIEE